MSMQLNTALLQESRISVVYQDVMPYSLANRN